MTLVDLQTKSRYRNEISSNQDFSVFLDDVIRNTYGYIYATEIPHLTDFIVNEVSSLITEPHFNALKAKKVYDFFIGSDIERKSINVAFEDLETFVIICPNLFLVTQAVRAISKRDPNRPIAHEIIFGDFRRFVHYLEAIGGRRDDFYSDKEDLGSIIHKWIRESAGLKIYN